MSGDNYALGTPDSAEAATGNGNIIALLKAIRSGIGGAGVGGSSGTVSAATLSSVNSAATSQTLLAANAVRKGVLITNTDANDLYVKYGATATTSGSGYSVIIPTGAYWEMPSPIFTGILAGIWAADGSGLAEITEL